MHPPIELLFLCTGNSCRSIMAEACCNARAGGRLHASSAGSQPTGFVHPCAVRQLTRAGIAVEGLQSKSWERLPSRPQLIITLCDSAAGESCPAYLGPAVRAHWGLPDPARVTGSEAVVDAAFEQVWQALCARIDALLALPIERWLADNPAALRTELERIGALALPDAGAH